MLTLITGKPGNGKGVYLLDEVLRQFPDRRIFVWGIKINDTSPYQIEQLEKPEEWYNLPDGSVVIVDECQKVFPPRSATSQPPVKCLQIAEHRHRGFDLIFITQDPKDIDAYVRRKVGRHIHIKRSVTNGERATIRILMNDVMDCDNRGWKGADKFNYNFNKKVYAWYHSSEIHTHKYKLPRKLIYAIILIVIIVVGYLYVANVVFNKSSSLIGVSNEDREVMQSHNATADLTGSYLDGDVSVDNESLDISGDEWLRLYTPRVEGIPWSAPIYDSATTSKRVYRPVPVCIASAERDNRCICHSQQGTRMAVSVELCRGIALNGYYDPLKPCLSGQCGRSFVAPTRVR